MTTQNKINKRSVTISEQHIDVEKRTVAIAFSSDKPYRRHFGDEILKHNRENVRMHRLENNAALLLDHDWGTQIGVVERAWLEDGKGRAIVRFSKSKLADEIFQDVVDGIRKHISVGYTVHQLEKDKDNNEQYNAVDWEPLEVSIVSVPADLNAGVGRNHEITQPQNNNKGNTMSNQELNTKSIEQGTDNERKRVSEIMAMGKQYGFEDAQGEFITEGRTPEQFRQHIIDAMFEKGSKPLKDNTQVSLGLSDSEARQFSFHRAMKYLIDRDSAKAREEAAFELEVSEAARQKGMGSSSGIAIPFDVLSRSNTHTMTGVDGDTSNASSTIKQNYLTGSFIDMLRNKSAILNIARHMNDLSGYITIPKQTGTTSAYWVKEKEAAQHSNIEYDDIHMRPHTIAMTTTVTKDLLENSEHNVEAMLRDDMAEQIALTIDNTALYGTGNGNVPLGLCNNEITKLEYGDTVSFKDFVELVKTVEESNALGMNMAYLMRPSDYADTSLIPRGNGIQAPIVDTNGSIHGYPVYRSNQIQKGQIIFGNFSDFIVGHWGGIELTVDPLTLLENRTIKIVIHQKVDFVVRRPESFVIANQQAALKKGAK